MDDLRNRRPPYPFMLEGVLTLSLLLAGGAPAPLSAGEGIEESPARESISGVASGSVFDWLEFSTIFDFDDHVSVAADIEVLWSANLLDPASAFFYVAQFPTAEIAVAPGILHVSEVNDATSLIYEADWYAGPIAVGEIVFFRNETSSFYGAMRMDSVDDSGGPQALADITWYLQQDGTADFSAFVFSDGFESGNTAYWSGSGS